jgi:vitamin B12 transporter
MKIFYFWVIILSSFFQLLRAQPKEQEILISVEGQEIDESPLTKQYQLPKQSLEVSSQKTLGDILKKENGFQFNSNFQGISTSTIRGLGNGNILVIWNGIRLNDLLDPSSSFDFSRLKLSGEEKIEVIRGPEASIWGSSATGAVVFIHQDLSKSKSHLEASYATYNSFNLEGLFQKNFRNTKSLIFGNLFSTEGISSASSKLGNSEKDGRNSQNGFAFSNTQLSQKWSLNTASFINHSFNEADLNGGPGGDEKGARDSGLNLALHLNALYDSQKNYLNKSSISYQKDFRYHKNSVEYARYESDFVSLQNENKWKIGEQHKLTSAFESDFEKANSTETTGIINKKKYSLGLRNLYNGHFEKFNFKAGLRLEKELNLSSKLNLAYFSSISLPVHLTNSIFHLSASKAFRRASLYQLFSSYGNSSLQAEDVISYEAGILQDLQKINSTFETTFFANHLKESIDFDFTTQKYFNGGSKRNYGVESVLENKWNNLFKTRTAYTWTHSQSLRVAEHKASLSLRCDISHKFKMSHEALFNGRKKDIDAVTYDVKLMKPYWLFNSYFEYKIKENLLARFHIDNILNTEYEEIDGFGSPGRYTKLSLKYTF